MSEDALCRIYFLDVGQGDGIYISAGDGSHYFIDGGSSDVNKVGIYRILPYLKVKGVKKIDYWFISHCDTDHMSGILEILENGYKIKHIVLHERCSTGEKEEYFIEQMRDYGVEILIMGVGDKIQSSNMQIICIAPDERISVVAREDKNDISMVLQLEWMDVRQDKSFTALFAGDISTEIESILCQSGSLAKVNLYKASHHGSDYSNGTQMLETIKPEYIVVSCAKNNRYGHPGVKAVERMEASGADIFYTMDEGRVNIQIDKKGLVKITSFLLQ